MNKMEMQILKERFQGQYRQVLDGDFPEDRLWGIRCVLADVLAVNHTKNYGIDLMDKWEDEVKQRHYLVTDTGKERD